MSNEISCEIEAPLPRGLTIFSLIDNDVLHDAIMIVEANVYGDVLDVFGAADVVDINDDTARRRPSPEHGNSSKLSPPPPHMAKLLAATVAMKAMEAMMAINVMKAKSRRSGLATFAFSSTTRSKSWQLLMLAAVVAM